MLKLGHIVKRRDGQAFRSGSGFDWEAVVIQVKPLIMVSEDGAMKWNHVNPADVSPTGYALPRDLARYMGRLDD